MDFYTEDHEEVRRRKRLIKFIKVGVKLLIAGLLFICWKNILPAYSYYLQLASFAGGIWITYKELRENNFLTMIFSLAGTIYLNPLYPIYFNETMQSIMLLILSIGFFISSIVDIIKPEPDHESSKFGG